MALQRTETAEALKPLDLKDLTAAKPPCITVRLPFESLDAARIRLRNAIRELEETAHADRGLLEPLRELEAGLSRERGGEALVLFRSPDVFTSIWLKKPIGEGVTVADHFCIRHIIPQLTGEQKFYVLALAQKGVRLLRCTDHSAEEVPLPAGTPHTYDEWFAPVKPDHVQDNMASGGPGEGSMKGVMFTTSTDREDKDEYLRHFYRAVEKGIREVLRSDPAPLVLAGVEYELPIYHEIDTYERTVAGGVQGAPDGLKGGELHARALELVRPYFEEPLRKALESFENMAPERRSTTAKEIVKAAYDGRVAHLFLNETGEYRGWFREATGEVKGHGKSEGVAEEDLLNAAAVRTLASGGNVFVLPGARMPNGAPAAAVFRW
ncbi:MAG TPA: hypothetical protein VFA04_11840 [Bryobacteraceae bacterium]|nr:hypothetical protein [Bryobacteraceae bacterium]